MLEKTAILPPTPVNLPQLFLEEQIPTHNFPFSFSLNAFPPPVKHLFLVIQVNSLTDHWRDQRDACACAQFSHLDQRFIPWVMPQLEC